jgi:hypothetical protein
MVGDPDENGMIKLDTFCRRGVDDLADNMGAGI